MRKAHIQHLIVEGEITHRHHVQMGLVLPVALTQLCTERFEIVAGVTGLSSRTQGLI